MTTRRSEAPAAPAPPVAEPRGFRPSARRRARIMWGAGLAAVAIGGNALLYSSLDDRREVLQVVRDVPAGQQVTAADLRVVQLGTDPTVRSVAADRIVTVVGQYAKVRIVSGSLVVEEALQPSPLVTSGSAVVAVQVSEAALPAGLRERSRVRLVVPPSPSAGDRAVLTVVEGRVVARPAPTDTVTGLVPLSVEVAETDAAALAAADDVRIVLLEPGVDPASDPAPGGP